jgi:DNA-binding CsgD family transcriptional regulator
LESRASYRDSLVAAIPDTLVWLRPDGRILDFIPGEELRNVITSGDVIGQNIHGLLPSEFLRPIEGIIRAALRTSKLERIEFEASAGNTSRSYEARCLPVRASEVLLILRDFTAIKPNNGDKESRQNRREINQEVKPEINPNPYNLTHREQATLQLIADGFADKQIGDTLGISTYTVNKHVGSILAKMKASSRTEASVRAIREALLE